MFQVVGKTNIDFIGKRYISFALSAVLIILGLVALIFVASGKAKLGIEFSGGTLIDGYFAQPVDIGQLRATMSENGYPDAVIQEAQREIPNSFVIRVKATAETGSKVAGQLVELIQENFPGNTFTLDSVDEVGPSVGQQLQSKARLAVLISLIGIMIYIWLRFDFRSGVAAAVSTFHDVLAVFGIMFILQKETNLLLITAILTLAGYSLTDKVVILDRIREDLKLYRKRGDFANLVNTAINEVLSRTIVTGTTVLLVLITLVFFGGEVLSDFALALFIGVLMGTYSSVFVASPLMVEWEKRSPKRFK
ncbi:MAG: protein-export membrane protein SecF [candidate division Zixibacteria bacterium RBG_16_50_21]|nr:MAG: protein-export membrane protein SecF [candidate division Zixibacteria bacterium RBG_16_50_21]